MIHQTSSIAALSDTRLVPKASPAPAQSSLAARLDYLTFKVDGCSQADFNACIEFLSGNIPLQYKGSKGAVLGIQYYDHSFTSLDGCIRGGYSVCLDEQTHEPVYDYFMALSGKYWERLGIVDQWRRLKGLHHTYKAHVTRLDGALDDSTGKIIDLHLIKQAHDLKDFKGVRDRSYAGHYDEFDRKIETLYFGSRQSEKFYRVYQHDKVARFELESKREVARIAFSYIASLEREEREDDEFGIYLQQQLGSIIIGGIDFVNRRIRPDGKREEKHTEQCPRHDWWQRIIDSLAEPMKIVREFPKHHNLGKSLNWLERQVIGTILCLKRAYEGKVGISWKTVLERQMLLFEKSGRWSDRHQLMLDTFLGERDSMAEALAD